MHQSQKANFVRTKKSFLNAEYYISPGSEKKMIPRDISQNRETTHELKDGKVWIHFPPEEEYNLQLDLAYHPHGDMVDMEMIISPMKDIQGFQIFFASYISESFDQTWVVLKNSNGSHDWTKLQNRENVNDVFGVMRDQEMFGLLENEYSKLTVKEEKQVFDKPILVARDSKSGLALIFLCDPNLTQYLAGQYHGWDTAHDWAFGSDLNKGIKMQTKTRMICRPFKDIDEMQHDTMELWSEFNKSCE